MLVAALASLLLADGTQWLFLIRRYGLSLRPCQSCPGAVSMLSDSVITVFV